MEGISKEYLESKINELYECADRGNDAINGLSAGANIAILKVLLHECKEINPWLPIDKNTPKDKELLLYYPARENDDDFDMPKIQSVGYWSVPLGIWVCDLRYLWGEEKSRLVQPTHYQELPEAPL